MNKFSYANPIGDWVVEWRKKLNWALYEAANSLTDKNQAVYRQMARQYRRDLIDLYKEQVGKTPPPLPSQVAVIGDYVQTQRGIGRVVDVKLGKKRSIVLVLYAPLTAPVWHDAKYTLAAPARDGGEGA